MNRNPKAMDWASVDAVAVVGLGLLFIMWADIIYGMTGSAYFNAIALYLLIGGSFLTVGACALVVLNGPRGRRSSEQTQLD